MFRLPTNVFRMEQVNVALGRAVGEALEDAGLSIREAADMTGIAATTLHRKVGGKGKTTFDVAELLSIARITDRSLGSLIPEALLS